MKSKHIILLILIPLSEIKAIFYFSDLKVRSTFFNDEKRYLCNVLEDYSNIIIFGVVFFYMTFLTIDDKTKQISKFLFVLNCLDLIHLGFLDMQNLIPIKLIITYLISKNYAKH
jgi:hypothetical protein